MFCDKINPNSADISPQERYIMIKHILFDIDGTLTEPTRGIINAIAYAMPAMGLPIPQNNEVVLSKGLAYLFSKDVGDSIEIHLQGVATRFTVVGIQPINSNFIFLSADAIESSTEITVFKLSDNENAIRDLITKLDSEGVSQIEKADIFGSIPGTIGAFLHLCLAVVAISALISLLGCTTLLYQQYHLRANERRILQQSGATRDTVCKIHCLEIGYILLISLLLAVLFGTAMAFAIDQGLLSFGMSLFT